MSLEALDKALALELDALQSEGRAKPPERVIVAFIPPQGERGPRYRLLGSDQEFLRMNSNSYLSLSQHPELVRAADEATHALGVGPGAVRFIDGTFSYHAALEARVAAFVGKPAAKVFNSAYTANCGLALALSTVRTYWIGDQLNHNSIIRAMRIAGVPSANKAIYAHNDMGDLRRCLEGVPEGMERVAVIFDGIFSMRGDFAPIDKIAEIAAAFQPKFKGCLFTVVDDSHATVIEAVRQKADTYIYTNPLSVADCAAAGRAIEICDGPEGRQRLEHLRQMTARFRQGIAALGWACWPSA